MNELVPGQLKVSDKSNEIAAFPKLFYALLLEGCIVTIDAIGCQKKIAKKIVKKNTVYILSVKENLRYLYEDIPDSFRVLPDTDFHEDLDYGHGRIETRMHHNNRP